MVFFVVFLENAAFFLKPISGKKEVIGFVGIQICRALMPNNSGYTDIFMDTKVKLLFGSGGVCRGTPDFFQNFSECLHFLHLGGR